MNEQIKEILLKQLQILQEACDRGMLTEDAARLSEALAGAVEMAARMQPMETLRN